MPFIKTALIIPAVLSSLWFVDTAVDSQRTKSSIAKTNVEKSGEKSAQKSAQKSIEDLEAKGPNELNMDVIEATVVERRMRIERVMVILDAVAQSAMEMGPEQVSWIEPVIEDIAERTLELISEEALLSDSSEVELNQIEDSVGKLVHALDKMVEPEVSL